MSQFSPATLWDIGIKLRSAGQSVKAISAEPSHWRLHYVITGACDLLVGTLSLKTYPFLAQHFPDSSEQ